MATDFLSNKASDVYRLAKSKTILTPAAATYRLIRIPKWSMVTDLWVWVQTAGSTKTVSFGWLGNGETAQTSGFMSLDFADVTLTGMKRATRDNFQSYEGKYFNAASGMITMTVGTTQTTGAFHVFVEYVVIL